MRFPFAIQAATLRPFARETPRQSNFQVLLHKALLDANDGAAADGERHSNLPISATGFTLALITHQQHSGHQIVLSGSTAHVDHRF